MLNLQTIMPLAAQDYSDEPNTWVFWAFMVLGFIAFLCSFATPIWQSNWENIKGEYNENNMRRLFMFNRQPYILVVHIAVSIILSAVIGAAILFLVGGIGYLLLWIVKLIIWAIIIIGWICLVGGVIALFGGGPVGCLPIIIGGLIVYYQDTLSAWGNKCVEAGFEFFNELNLWEYCQYLWTEYSLTLLTIAAIPIAIGVAAAVLALLCSFVFWIVETVITRKYNIKHPCPFCHNPSEPAIYLSENVELPIRLRPSWYGLLHVTHPVTGESMPTMLLNGRDELPRKCPHCDRIINYKTGVEKHIAFVGLPESGKTCLTYRFIGNMMKNDYEIQFTDDVNKEAQRIILDVKNGKEQELASKTSVNDMRRSLQILVPGKAPLPYHFFINDVGGELFTTSGVESNYMQFFKDVESVSFLIDPFTMDFSEYETSGDFGKMYKTNIIGKKQLKHTEKFSNVLQTVKTMSDQFVHKTKNIHVNIILVKSDTGYIPKDVLDNETKLKDMVITQMGMAAEVMDLENTYASLHFYAVSALKDYGIDRLTAGIIEDLNIKL